MPAEMTTRRRAAARFALVAALVALIAAAALPGAAWARGAIDVDATCSLAVENAPTDVQGGVPFALYKVAGVNEVGDEYTPCADFASYAVDLMPADSAGWRSLAQTLSAYAARDGLTPVATGVSNVDGELSFAKLPTGLYLLVGQASAGATSAYSIEPVMIQLPDLDTTTGHDVWVYDAKVALKWGTDVFSSVTALKVWDDNGVADVARPVSVEAQLLRNGAVVAQVELSNANNWRYTWEGLDPNATWQVVEASVPEGFTTSVGCEGGVFTVTNTAKTPPSSTGDGPDAGQKLPQTGMLWWPVPLLAAAGLALCLAGVIRRRRQGGR